MGKSMELQICVRLLISLKVNKGFTEMMSNHPCHEFYSVIHVYFYLMSRSKTQNVQNLYTRQYKSNIKEVGTIWAVFTIFHIEIMDFRTPK